MPTGYNNIVVGDIGDKFLLGKHKLLLQTTGYPLINLTLTLAKMYKIRKNRRLMRKKARTAVAMSICLYPATTTIAL